MKILSGMNPALILVIIIVAIALIALIPFIIYKVTHPKLKNDKDKKDEKQCVQEELDRILQPVEDEDVAKEINDYKDSDE